MKVVTLMPINDADPPTFLLGSKISSATFISFFCHAIHSDFDYYPPPMISLKSCQKGQLTRGCKEILQI